MMEKSERVEPILPWDEIFFELDPFEEVLAKDNVGSLKKIQQKKYRLHFFLLFKA